MDKVLPFVMHPLNAIGIGITINALLAIDNSPNGEILQFSWTFIIPTFEHFKKYIFFWFSPSLLPPMMACPIPNVTIECSINDTGNSGPEIITKF